MSCPEAWLRRQARRTPDETALICEGRTVTFAALDHQIDGLAQTLLDQELAPARPLGCVTAHAETLVRLALAGPRAGIPLLPANPKLTQEQIEALFAKAGVVSVLCDDGKADPAIGRRIGLPETLPRDAPQRAADPASVHLIIATSGSTGTPKGAMLTGANLAAAVRASRQRLPIGPGDVWLGCLPTYHIGGLSVMFRCLEAGAGMRLHPRFDLPTVAADIEAGLVTHVSLVPAMLAQLLDAGCRPSPRLRCALIGGAGLPAALAEKAAAAGWPICPSYGMSEVGSQAATCVRIEDWHPGMAGEPLPGLEIGTSPAGRIRVRGPSLMAGYVNPELRPGDGLTEDGWFETNDLGGLDPSGLLRVLGRADDLLISGGENVHPATVEDIAGHCPGVSAIGITGRPDPTWGDLLVAVVVGTVEETNFLDWCRAHVPSHQRPRAMVKAAALPMNKGGKLDRAALREMAALLTGC
ncbi:class I adenylate-forming enzyme family protein [Telmatospirillum siberiense]|uniref:2-succinylbenzoate--CoA ligase n=1 Tax=Telmatospirillum siberiense TaxID=382514 RepID=A0A2N3PMG9_9PROT|nr:class I adenylate-forming enzyme family protein [Telmatospirillum siberiense]PKU21595.1 2-succinylbenzoate--CoA ligase [Telmatospirillum siberiense]